MGMVALTNGVFLVSNDFGNSQVAAIGFSYFHIYTGGSCNAFHRVNLQRDYISVHLRANLS